MSSRNEITAMRHIITVLRRSCCRYLSSSSKKRVERSRTWEWEWICWEFRFWAVGVFYNFSTYVQSWGCPKRDKQRERVSISSLVGAAWLSGSRNHPTYYLQSSLLFPSVFLKKQHIGLQYCLLTIRPFICSLNGSQWNSRLDTPTLILWS